MIDREGVPFKPILKKLALLQTGLLRLPCARYISSWNGFLISSLRSASPPAALITRLIKKKWIWGEEQEEVFQLKNALISAPVLAYPDFNRRFIFRTLVPIDLERY